MFANFFFAFSINRNAIMVEIGGIKNESNPIPQHHLGGSFIFQC